MKRPLYNRSRGGNTRSSSSGSHARNWDGKTTSSIRSTSSILGNSPITKQNGIDDTYADILGHNAGDDSFNQLLSALGIEQQKGLTGGQRDDWNKQLLDAQLQHYMDVEKRQYTADTLAEQRLYDSPTNQLARLMGAGISRDAAIAMLQGGQQATLAESAVSPTGISASESAANELNSKLGIANAVFNGVSALSGLVGLGFTIPQAIQQVNYLKNQNWLTGSQIAAYKSTGQAYSILKSINAASSAFGSVSSAVDAITQAAKDGNTDAAAFIASGGIDAMKQNAPFASSTLGNLYKSERSSQDYAQDYIRRSRLEEGSIRLQQVEYEKVRQDIINLGAEFEQILSSTEFIEAQTATQKQIEKLTGQQFLNQWMNNDVQYHTLYSKVIEINGETKKGIEWLTDAAVYKAYTEAKVASMCTDPEYQETLFQKLFTDAESSMLFNMFNIYRHQASLEFAEQQPNLSQLCMALEDCGVFAYLEALNNSVLTESQSFSAHGVSNSTSGQYVNPATNDFIEEIDKKTNPLLEYKKRKLRK